MKNFFLLLCFFFLLQVVRGQNNALELTTDKGTIKITPIQHATMLIEYEDIVIATDPTGGEEAFKGLSRPNLILITDIHGDHMNLETLEEMKAQNIDIVAPQAVADKLGASFKELKVIAIQNP